MYKLTGVIPTILFILFATSGQDVSATPCLVLADCQSLPLLDISEPAYTLCSLIEPIPPVIADEAEPESVSAPRYIPTNKERELLAALVWREDHTSMESMMAVAEVVLNRIDSDHHSFRRLDTVEQALFQASWINGCYVEQYAYADTLLEECPTPEAYEAVDRVCAGETLLGADALFHTEKSVPSWKIANDIYVVDEIGSSKFWGLEGN
ncbi:MAG: cell wall hydrolase [Eubacteriales bacterium]